MDMGAEHLRRHYGELFQVRHENVYDTNAATCSVQADYMDDMLARVYYRISGQSNATVVIFHGTVFCHVYLDCKKT